MIRTILITCIVLLPIPLAHAQARPADSVVMIHAKIRGPNVVRPWLKSPAEDYTGTGVVVAGNKILTNAHLVHYAEEIEVQFRPGTKKYPAVVVGKGRAMDLAVLSIKNKQFFKKHPPLPRLKKTPKVQDTAVVFGFPIGGNTLSVTRGTVSRIEYGEYGYGGYGLRIQVTAAINVGNSGGPALVNGKMVGLVFGQDPFAENTGYVIPNEEIDTFLKDIEDGKYDGKPFMESWAYFQGITNPALREMLKLKKEVTGVMISPSDKTTKKTPLQAYDVVTHIGPYALDSDGMIRPPGTQGRMPFTEVCYKIAKNGAVAMTVIRQGKTVKIRVPVTTSADTLLRAFRGEQPSYFIYGPFVFSPARTDAMRLYGRMNPSLTVDRSPLAMRFFDQKRFPGEELVVVTSPMFEHKCVRGYQDPQGRVIQDINGQPVKNLKHLVELLRDVKDDFVKLRFAQKGSHLIVLRRGEMERVTTQVMEDNGIPIRRRMSADLQKTWEKKDKKKGSD